MKNININVESCGECPYCQRDNIYNPKTLRCYMRDGALLWSEDQCETKIYDAVLTIPKSCPLKDAK